MRWFTYLCWLKATNPALPRCLLQVPVTCMDGRLWVRLSAQVYNTMHDYARLGDAIDDMRAQGSNNTC